MSNSKKLSDIELLRHLDEGLKTVRALCEVYDAGHHYVAFSLATEVRKVLVDNPAGVRARGQRLGTAVSEFPKEIVITVDYAFAQT